MSSSEKPNMIREFNVVTRELTLMLHLIQKRLSKLERQNLEDLKKIIEKSLTREIENDKKPKVQL